MPTPITSNGQTKNALRHFEEMQTEMQARNSKQVEILKEYRQSVARVQIQEFRIPLSRESWNRTLMNKTSNHSE